MTNTWRLNIYSQATWLLLLYTANYDSATKFLVTKQNITNKY